ncbi:MULTISPECIES: CopD family protein [Halomonadaceae]|uniref:CopD family protein n=1 Tax=Halomonadaceae TaxID=28256 RepID=UPI001598355B|nr:MULTISPECIES: CopD family protein [Halomonas]QJQ94746.1 hypothetical protein HIO72_05235 [Halomonas sp. PA5]
MPWIKILHIATLLFWCGALLYLPALLLSSARSYEPSSFNAEAPPIPRFLFTNIATPAALLAIFSGTLLFLVYRITGGWLVVKLGAVMGMVMCHALCGFLLVRLEQGKPRGVRMASWLVASFSSLMMLAVLVLVLSEPF